jgi:hydrogenase maturation protein HypF
MTSGNASGEPIACTRAEARRRLAPMVDGLLHHDRAIAVPAEDSVVLPIGAHALTVRRSRGHVPAALHGPVPAPEPILAFGAQLANTVCIARGGRLHPSEHVGDLESPEALERQTATIARLESWLGVQCEVVAHDLHPGYTSTQAARRREATLTVAVQHHHAHVASALVELGRTDPVVGIAFDGTGAGTDGAAWGGEILLVRPDRFERLATLRPLPLLGGETAIREVWRLALAMLEDAFGDEAPIDAFPVFRQVERDRLDAARALAGSDFPLVRAHGAGRWFDAFGALFLDRAVATHSGEIAMHWNAAADDAEDRAYPFSLAPPGTMPGATGHVPHVSVDLREAVRAAVVDRLAGRAPGSISGRFHATLAAATTAVLEREHAAVRGCPVVLTGGCFQNALLTRRVGDALGARHAVHRHERVPPGDGGISIGQALVAAAVARAGGGDAHLRGEGA